MEGTITFIAVLSAIIYIAFCVMFVLIFLDIRAIKKMIGTKSDFKSTFALYFYSGEKEKAKNLLFDEIRQEYGFEEFFIYKSRKEEIIKNYQVYFDMLEIKLDYDSAKEFAQKTTSYTD